MSGGTQVSRPSRAQVAAHFPPPPRMMDCPICLDRIPADGGQLYENVGGKMVKLTIGPNAGQRRVEDSQRTASRRCPNPSGGADEHFLPLALSAPHVHPPLVVGLVGASQSGKTHLLAAMVGALARGDLDPYGLHAEPIDFARHQRFMSQATVPLVSRSEKLSGTISGVNDIADAFMITSSLTGSWPVAFFDIAGEDLTQTGNTGRFLAGAKALIFVVDPGLAMGWSGTEVDSVTQNQLGDDTFSTVLGRIGHGTATLDIPAVVVINKSDRLRFRPPVDAWMRRPSDRRLDPERIRAESRDAFALLYEHQAQSWLQPFYRCARSTLHFATATGGEAGADERYPRGARPGRVLEPLLALFAMTGVLAGPGIDEVGT
jgi:hypothetical protein